MWRRRRAGSHGLGLAILCGVIAPLAGAEKLVGWNVSIVSFTSHADVPAVSGGMWINAQTETSLFQVGEPVTLVCPYSYQQIGAPQNFRPFDIGIIALNGGGVAEKHDVTKFDKFAAPNGLAHTVFVPKHAGTFEFLCSFNGVDENNQDDERKLTVKIVPQDDSGYVGSFPAPVPVIVAPVKDANFSLEPGARLYLRVTLPPTPFANVKDIAAYAVATPYDERWHIDILRRGSGATSGFEDEVAAFAGPLTSLEFGSIVGQNLTTQWFEQHGGAGLYRIRVYLTQKVQAFTKAGAQVSVDFEVTPQAKTMSLPKPGHVPAAAGGTAIPPPPGSHTRAVGPVKKPGSLNEAAATDLVVPLPDLVAEKQNYEIAGVVPTWDISTSVDDKAASKVENGRCFFRMKLFVRNAGAAPSGSFMGAVRDDEAGTAAVMQWRSIPPRGVGTVEQLMELRPGDNHLSFTIDPHFEVKESDESNNKQLMRVFVKGKCQRAPPGTRTPVRRQ
jgi:hypothetical protein